MDQPVPLPRASSRTRLPVPVQRQSITENNRTTNTSTILHVAEVHSIKTDNKDGSSGEGEAEDDSSGRMEGNGEKRKKKLKRKGTFLVRNKSPMESTTDDPINTTSQQKPTEIPESWKSSSALASSKTSSMESMKLPITDTPSSATPKPSSQPLEFESMKKNGSNTSSVESINEAASLFKMPAPPRRGSLTETLSESSSDRERKRINLKPLSQAIRNKKPSGYATETLSEDSSQQNSPSRPSSVPPPKQIPKQSKAGILAVSSEEITASSRTSTLNYPAELSSPVIPIAGVKSEPNSQSIPIHQRETTLQHSGPSEQHTPEHQRTSPKEILSPGLRTKLPESAKPPLDSPSYYTSSSVDYKDVGGLPPPRAKRPKKKRKIKETSGTSTENYEQGSSTSQDEHKEETNEGTDLTDEKAVLCITVHKCEPLRMKDLHKRPCVRIHPIDTTTSDYRRSAFGKNFIDLVQTQAFDHIQNRSVVPSWEEDLIFMEPASHIVSAECILIFELLESETDDLIAWAFLKPLAANGKRNVGSALRLQLYKPLKSRSQRPSDIRVPLAFIWYSKNKLSAYKSTLLVTLHSVDSQLITKPVKPSAIPLKNQSRRRSSQTSSSPMDAKLSEAEKELIGVVWSRLPSLSCKLPNKINTSLPAGPDGGMSLSYSRSGLLVACHTTHTISVFTYLGSRYLTLSGHHGLVYDLSWSPDDSFLLSSSADTTACVWNVKLKQTTPVAILNHPSYVYCGTWIGPTLVVTGCYDRGLRLWDLAGVPTLLPQNASVSSSSSQVRTSTYDPLQCATSHRARVNTLAVLSSDEIMVSGDSDGALIFWKLSTTIPRKLELSREVTLSELKGQVINKVCAHPGGKRILVASRDSKLRMIDLQSLSVIQWFHGGVNIKLQSGSCFCGCGSRVLSCSEDGNVSVWDANTGERIALYKGLYLPDSPAVLTFHPKDNMFALVSHKVGTFPHIVLSLFTRDASGNDIGVEWIDNRSVKPGRSSSVSDLSLQSSRESIADRPVRKKKKGVLHALLRGGAKLKHKKGITNGAYTDTESGEGTSVEPTRTGQKKHSAFRILETLDVDGEVNSRLTDIIKRMDNLIITASPSRPHVY